jgi:RNA polymerase sigma factor (sigma-70 family)
MFISYQKNTDRKTLWERYVQGDKSAFGQLYAHYHKALTAFCIGRLKNIELAENAASDTLIKLLQHPNPVEILNFESWLFTVAKNECTSYWTTTERRKKLLENNYDMTTDRKPEIEETFSLENIDHLIRNHLDETDYKIWQLHQQGYDNREISDILQIGEKTVANRKSAARAKLKSILKEYSANARSI